MSRGPGPTSCFCEFSHPAGGLGLRGSQSVVLCCRAEPVGLLQALGGGGVVWGSITVTSGGKDGGPIQRPLVSLWCGFPSGPIP